MNVSGQIDFAFLHVFQRRPELEQKTNRIAKKSDISFFFTSRIIVNFEAKNE